MINAALQRNTRPQGDWRLNLSIAELVVFAGELLYTNYAGWPLRRSADACTIRPKYGYYQNVAV